MPHLGAFVPSNYFAFIYVSVYKCERVRFQFDNGVSRRMVGSHTPSKRNSGPN